MDFGATQHDSTRLVLDLNLLMWANKNFGTDCSILTDGDLGSEWKISSRLSYTYMIPKAVDPDLVYYNYNDRLDDLLQNFLNEGLIDENLLPLVEQITAQDSQLSFNSTSSNPESETLKYRYRHMAKLDLEISRKSGPSNPFALQFIYGKHRPTV